MNIEAMVTMAAEMAAVMTDLHWLIHQGHVIEFANGILETAKKPLPKPPPKPAKPEAKPGATAAPATTTADSAVVSVEAPAAEVISLPGESTSTVEPSASETMASAPGDAPAAGEAQPAS